MKSSRESELVTVAESTSKLTWFLFLTAIHHIYIITYCLLVETFLCHGSKYYMLTEGGSQANAYTSKVLHKSPYDGMR